VARKRKKRKNKEGKAKHKVGTPRWHAKLLQTHNEGGGPTGGKNGKSLKRTDQGKGGLYLTKNGKRGVTRKRKGIAITEKKPERTCGGDGSRGTEIENWGAGGGGKKEEPNSSNKVGKGPTLARSTLFTLTTFE